MDAQCTYMARCSRCHFPRGETEVGCKAGTSTLVLEGECHGGAPRISGSPTVKCRRRVLYEFFPSTVVGVREAKTWR